MSLAIHSLNTTPKTRRAKISLPETASETAPKTAMTLRVPETLEAALLNNPVAKEYISKVSAAVDTRARLSLKRQSPEHIKSADNKVQGAATTESSASNAPESNAPAPNAPTKVKRRQKNSQAAKEKVETRARREELIEIRRNELIQRTNILNREQYLNFKNGVLFDGLQHFSIPSSTTHTLEGYESGISFHEGEILPFLRAEGRIVKITSNFGSVKQPGWMPFIQPKSNRGRKKKTRRPTQHKLQGSGKEFNTQVSFYILRSDDPCIEQLCTVDSEHGEQKLVWKKTYYKPYKFKVFRNGKLQLPGVRQNKIDDVMSCIPLIIKTLTDAIERQTGVRPKTETKYVYPLMKNFKFTINLPKTKPPSLVDLNHYAQLINAFPPGDGFPPLFSASYRRENNKMHIKFYTPLPHRPQKKILINVFGSGKINILGASDYEATRKICVYLHSILEKYYRYLIVQPGKIAQADLDEFALIIEDGYAQQEKNGSTAGKK